MDVRFINRYHSYCASLAALEKARGRDPKDEFVLSGTVQKFALTFDISWKVMKVSSSVRKRGNLWSRSECPAPFQMFYICAG